MHVLNGRPDPFRMPRIRWCRFPQRYRCEHCRFRSRRGAPGNAR